MEFEGIVYSFELEWYYVSVRCAIYKQIKFIYRIPPFPTWFRQGLKYKSKTKLIERERVNLIFETLETKCSLNTFLLCTPRNQYITPISTHQHQYQDNPPTQCHSFQTQPPSPSPCPGQNIPFPALTSLYRAEYPSGTPFGVVGSSSFCRISFCCCCCCCCCCWRSRRSRSRSWSPSRPLPA